MRQTRPRFASLVEALRSELGSPTEGTSRVPLRKLVKRFALMAPVLAIVTMGLGACSGKEDGSPVGGNTTSAQTPGSSGPFPTGGPGATGSATTGPGLGKGPLAGQAPCSLLGNSEIGRIGAQSGVEMKLGQSRACEYKISGAGVLYIAVFDSLGVKDLRAAQVTPTQVGGREAMRGISGAGCEIAIATSESSRVDAVFTHISGDEQKSCELAMQVAQLVEPKLP